MSSWLASFPVGALGLCSFLRRPLVIFSPYLVDLTGLSTSVDAALRLGILSLVRGVDRIEKDREKSRGEVIPVAG